ncbi:type IV pilin N-terminal domain-containing protein [Haloferax sp. S1W]|uniref:type IV pilin N-terminal domain-containing protein n=1 Tax=Haloferax sp. S1W TaxID=3377110 RepID=UPI0037C8F207
MLRGLERDDRGASEVVGGILLVAIVVVLSATTATFMFGTASSAPEPAPSIDVSHTLVDGDEVIAVTLDAGDSVRTDRLYVIGSDELDIGSAPGSSTAADDSYASKREQFTESSGDNPPQVGIGETWGAGETVYLDPVGSDAHGTTVSIYWSTRPVQGINPGTVSGEQSHKLLEFTV